MSLQHGKTPAAGGGNQKKKKLIITLCIIGGVLILGGIALAAFLVPALTAPETLFPTVETTSTPAPTATAAAAVSPTPSAEVTEAPTFNSSIVNILLMGVENKNSEDPVHVSSPGEDAHTDVVMLAAVNFEDNTVNLISLPRDTFVVNENIRGCYKLNAVINYGGGKEAEGGAGFLTTCSAASILMGGIPIDYYCAVDFQAVISCVDAIGGVDYDMDMNYSASGIDYTVGETHLDGNGVLDYLRARQNAEGATDDASRVVRQKRMLVAILDQLQRTNKLSAVPKIVSSVKKGLYTNLTLQQITALANFAVNVDPASVGAYTVGGNAEAAMPGGGAPDGWTFDFINVEERDAILEEVYGCEGTPLKYCSYEFSEWLRYDGFYAWNAQYYAGEVLEWAKENGLESKTKDLQSACDALEQSYLTAAESMYDSDTEQMYSDISDVWDEIYSAADETGYEGELSQGVDDCWYEDISINTVTVDFN